MLFSDQITSVATAMARQLEEEIRRALDAHWPDGWTYDDVRRRCVLQRYAHDPVEVFCADGKPLLYIWPVESEIEDREFPHVLRYTRKVRRLYQELHAPTGGTDNG